MFSLSAKEETLTTFHSDEYIDLIKNVTPENRGNFEDQLYRFNFKEDCPVMERLYDYCLSYTTGSIGKPLVNISDCCHSDRGKSEIRHQLVWRASPC